VGRLKNELSWSKSRAQLFESCRRRYWFHYYGSWDGWEGNASERCHAAWVLKKLQTRWMWAGDLVHRTIAETLEAMRAGATRDAEKTADGAVETMRQEYDDSRKKKYWRNPNRHCGLLEHEYEVELPDDRWGEVADHVRHCVGAFFKSPFPEKLTGLPEGAWLPIERLSSFLLEGRKVYVKPDFAYRSEEGAVIIDWKTGRKDEAADPVQLACYTLYALDKDWASSPEKVVAIEYNLARGRAREEAMSAARVEEVRGHILASLAEMRPLHEGPEKDFPVTGDAKVCRDCPFRKICPEKPL
jgi:CRISPR/Cas system-associated exonuclease Cas4 (RecB family)